MLVATIGLEPISHDYKSCALPIELYRYEAEVLMFRPRRAYQLYHITDFFALLETTMLVYVNHLHV